MNPITPQEADSWFKLIERTGLALFLCIVFGVVLYFLVKWILTWITKKVEVKLDNIAEDCKGIGKCPLQSKLTEDIEAIKTSVKDRTDNVIKDLTSETNDVSDILTTHISNCNLCEKNLDGMKKDIDSIARSLIIHTGQNKALKLEIVNLIKFQTAAIEKVHNSNEVFMKFILKERNGKDDSTGKG